MTHPHNAFPVLHESPTISSTQVTLESGEEITCLVVSLCNEILFALAPGSVIEFADSLVSSYEEVFDVDLFPEDDYEDDEDLDDEEGDTLEG